MGVARIVSYSVMSFKWAVREVAAYGACSAVGYDQPVTARPWGNLLCGDTGIEPMIPGATALSLEANANLAVV